MADAIEKSIDKNIEEVTSAVPSKTGEISDTDLQKVTGGDGKEAVTFEYGAIQVTYVKQD